MGLIDVACSAGFFFGVCEYSNSPSELSPFCPPKKVTFRLLIFTINCFNKQDLELVVE